VEGIRALVCIAGGGVLLFFFLRFFFWDEYPVAIVFFSLLFGIGLTVGAIWGVMNLTLSSRFVCRLSREKLECVCPIAWVGETFTVRVSEIQTLVRGWHGGENSMSYSWYIHDKSGQRYLLTKAYGNPVKRFFAKIKELNPEVAEICPWRTEEENAEQRPL
jgi:hypothetical protein